MDISELTDSTDISAPGIAPGSTGGAGACTEGALSAPAAPTKVPAMTAGSR